MEGVLAVFFFVLGTVIGSFLNVVVLRFNTGRSVGGRSRCFSCRQMIAWYDLIPLASFFLLLGRCRACRSKISLQYPFMEFASGLVTLALAYRFFPGMFGAAVGPNLQISWFALGSFILHEAIFSLLLVIATYDLRHKIIPDSLVYTFAVLTLAAGLFSLSAHWSASALAGFIFAGPLLASPLFLLWAVSGGRWIGLGDAKLTLGLGWLLGLSLGASALLCAFWIGAGASISVMILGRLSRHGSDHPFIPVLSLASEIPFAPFLVVAAALVFFFRFDVSGLSYFL